MKRERRVVILGGGIGGLATAFFLGAEEGVDVTLVEREPRHDAHSSGRSAEILRTAIDDAITEELGHITSTLLRAPREIGLAPQGPLVDDRGIVVITEASDDAGHGAPWVQRHLDRSAARAMGMDELHEVAPHFAPRGSDAWLLPGGGQIDVTGLLGSLARGAMARGVRFLRSTGDASPRVERGRVTGVDVRGTHLGCDALVIAAGAWSGPIGRSIGAPLPLRSTRRHMWVTGAEPNANPDAPIVWDDVAGFYARPEPSPHGGRAGDSSGIGWAFSATDLDDFDLLRADPKDGSASLYSIDSRERRAALAAARVHLPIARRSLSRSWRGFRDLAPDDRPILGPDSRLPGLFWCAGLGGHGMTISLATGQVVAEAVAGRDHPLTELCSAQRFEPAPR